MYTRRFFDVVARIIILGSLFVGCSPAAPTLPSLQPIPVGTIAPSQPDLVVVGVNLYPSQPQASQVFRAVVTIKNQGNAPSGEYDIGMTIKDVSRGYAYPVGTFRQTALQPGEQVPWQSNDLMVNDPGAFQYWVEIMPFNFQDGDEQNNVYGWAFQAAP